MSAAALVLFFAAQAGVAQTGNISVRVKDGITDAGVSNIRCDFNGPTITFAISNSSGFCTVSNVPYGQYAVTPTKSGYYFTPASRTATLQSSSMTLSPFLRYASNTTYQISGTIRGPNGQPLNNIAVDLQRDGNATQFTNTSGAYQFGGLTDGSDYTVRPRDGSYDFSPSSCRVDNISSNRTCNFDASDAVVSNDLTVAINNVLGDTTYPVAGGGTVELYRQGVASPYRTAQTDSSRNAVFNNVPEDSYYVRVFNSGAHEQTEFWGQSSPFAVDRDQTYAFNRLEPYISGLPTFYKATTGQLIAAGATVPEDTLVEVHIPTAGPSTNAVNARLDVRADGSSIFGSQFINCGSGFAGTTLVCTFGATEPGAYDLGLWLEAATQPLDTFDYQPVFSVDAVVIGKKILSVPYFYQGTTNWCGWTSIAMLMKYMGHDVRPRDVAKHFLRRPDQGTAGVLVSDLSDYFTTHAEASEIEFWEREFLLFGNLRELKPYLIESIYSDRPVFLGVSDKVHAIVVVGVDDGGIYVHDPSGAITSAFSGVGTVAGYLSWSQFGDLYTILANIGDPEFMSVRLGQPSSALSAPVTVQWDTCGSVGGSMDYGHVQFFSQGVDHCVAKDGTATHGYSTTPSPGKNSERPFDTRGYGRILYPTDQINWEIRASNASAMPRSLDIRGMISEIDLVSGVTLPGRSYSATANLPPYFSEYKISLLDVFGRGLFDSSVTTIGGFGFVDVDPTTIQYARIYVEIGNGTSTWDSEEIIIAVNDESGVATASADDQPNEWFDLAW